MTTAKDSRVETPTDIGAPRHARPNSVARSRRRRRRRRRSALTESQSLYGGRDLEIQ